MRCSYDLARPQLSRAALITPFVWVALLTGGQQVLAQLAGPGRDRHLLEVAGGAQQFPAPGHVPEGLSASDWGSIHAAYEAGRHAFAPVDEGWRARNPGQQWTSTFDGRGAITTPDAGGWQWGLALTSYGYGDRQQAVGGAPVVVADGQRLTYRWNETVEEWYVNDRRGLEHGFTVKERPSTSAGNAALLAFTLAVRGDLLPTVTAGARGLQFRDAHGRNALTYDGLKVWDADGDVLPAHFEHAANSVRLVVDDRGARYPITIDPIAQQAYLKASNNGSADRFGFAVAISGETVVVSALGEGSNATGVDGDQTNNLAPNSGAAYVFVRTGATWTQQAYLKASNTEASDGFGQAVAISGETIVISADKEDSNATGVDGDQTNNSAPSSSSGAAYVFVRSGSTWTQQAYLKASNTDGNDQFGFALAISGETVVVGAAAESSNATGVNGDQTNNSVFGAGAAYVFVRSGSTWTQQAYLKASNTQAGDQFAVSVAISGETLVLGANFEDSNATGANGNETDNSIPQAGAAYVFVRSGATWSQQAYLKASNPGSQEFFGHAVSISEETIVVAAFREASDATGVNGDQSSNAALNSGAAYVFVRSGSTWSQQAYLKASNTQSGDLFGYAVGIDGETIVVGAGSESSNATGVNGDQTNNLAGQSGAVYVFLRNGSTWTQQAYLKASNTGTLDQFGRAVAISGRTVIAGATAEDSNATGVNGNQADESSTTSGAAYIFLLPVNDCNGVPDGPALPGSACNDGDPATINDTWSAGCECIGTPCTPPAIVTVYSNPYASCVGGVVNLYVNATGTNLVYSWTGPGTIANANTPNAQVTNAQTSNYNLLISNGCGSTESNLGIVVNTPPTLSAVVTDASCMNASDGAIDLTVTNGAFPILITWTAPGGCLVMMDCPPAFPTCQGGMCNAFNAPEDLTGLPPGTYTVSVNAGNCIVAQQFTVGAATTDSDGDGDPDCMDPCPFDPTNDMDGDLVCGQSDNCPFVANPSQADADADGLGDACDPCPLLANLVNGNACDDGDPNTTGDLVVNCVCAGTPVVTCTEYLVLEFQTDGAPFQTTWEIRSEDGTTVITSGGPLVAPLGIQTEFPCLPAGCYTLRVLDAAGDGMTTGTTGGYILRTVGGERIIDDRKNFSAGSLSAISAGQGFCLPMSSDKVIFTSCDKLDWVSGQYVVTTPNAAVSAQWLTGVQTDDGYEFWIFDPNGTYSFRRFRNHATSDGFGPASATRACHMKLNNWAPVNQVPANVLMNVRVRARVNNVNGAFGPACRLMIDPVRAACPLSKLMDIPGNQFLSCGSTRQYGTGNFVHARPVSGADRYQIRFRIPAEGFDVTRTVTTYFVQLNWTGPTALQDGKTYDVDVRVSKDGGLTWCTTADPWGDVCLLTIDNTPANTGNQNFASEAAAAELRMFPNPNRGDVLNFSISAIEEGVNSVSVDIYDLTGKRVSASTIAVSGSHVNTVLDLNGELATGLYLVNITAGDTVYTERLVIQP